MKGILAIDPGITTGACFLWYSDEASGEFETRDFTVEEMVGGLFDDWVQPYYDRIPDISVIIEDTPIPTLSLLNQEMKKVIFWLANRFHHGVKVRPGVWKPVTQHLPRLKGVSAHENDAFRIATYYRFDTVRKDSRAAS